MEQAAKQHIKKKTKVVSVKLLLLLSLFCLTLFVFWMIVGEIVHEHENNFDSSVFSWLANITNPGVTKIMLAFTFFGSSEFLLPFYIILTAFYLIKKNSKLSVNVAVTAISGTALLFFFKHIFQRKRPLDPLVHNLVGFSFPSGHSFSAFTFFGLLIYILWQQPLNIIWKWSLSAFCFLMASLIAISRVYLHAHYASDVLAGFCLSTMWLIISFWLLDIIDKKFNLK